MKYVKFTIENYRAIKDPLEIDLKQNDLIPLVGINECGKTTILQSIFCFDHYNDSQYNGNHLKNSLNLYQTSDKNPVITAKIEMSYRTLKDIIGEFNEDIIQSGKESDEEDSDNEADDADSNDEETDEKQESDSLEIPFTQAQFPGYIEVTRDLATKSYSIAGFEDVAPKNQQEIAYLIISRLPYILYNDDFNDRPPTFGKTTVRYMEGEEH